MKQLQSEEEQMEQNQHTEKPELTIDGISMESLKRNKFSTPEGYFDNLAPRVMAAVRETESVSSKPSFNWWRILVPSLGCASVLIGMYLFNLDSKNTQLNFNEVVATITLEELDDYANFDSEELLAFELVCEEERGFSDVIENEDAIEYLLEEDLNIDDLYNEIDI